MLLRQLLKGTNLVQVSAEIIILYSSKFSRAKIFDFEMNHKKILSTEISSPMGVPLDQQWIMKIVVCKKLRRLNHKNVLNLENLELYNNMRKL